MLKVENTLNSSIINAFLGNHLIRCAVLSQVFELVSLQKRKKKRFLLAHSFSDVILWQLLLCFVPRVGQEKSSWKSKNIHAIAKKQKQKKQKGSGSHHTFPSVHQ